ncbi:MAG: DUF1194 domain-containing protein, partial [Aestuariivirgaceae bacterium]
VFAVPHQKSLVSPIAVAAIALTLLVAAMQRPAAAQSPVPLELLLAVDASGSVSGAEFDLQVTGLANAFRDPAVIAAIRSAGPGGIAVALMQWSSPGQQTMAVDWYLVSDSASAELLAQKITAAGRLILGETSIDAALRFATAEISRNNYLGRRQVIDLSGDGATNWGALPDDARDEAVAAGITINALAIVNEQPDLGQYYQDHVIGGSDAFVVQASDYGDFARAIRQKLIEEIQGRPAAKNQKNRQRKES